MSDLDLASTLTVRLETKLDKPKANSKAINISQKLIEFVLAINEQYSVYRTIMK